VKTNGTSTGGRLIVFEHSSGYLAIKLGSWCTFTPICFDISDEGSMIEWHGPDGGFGTWIRSATLDSSAVEDALKAAEKAALEQVASEGQQLFNIYLTCKCLEVKLKQLILQGGESAAMIQSAVNSVVRILHFT